MAIGTAAAIGLGVAGIGSAVGASANRKAASKAAQTSQQATDASVGLQRDIYNQNRGMLSPFVQRGNAAGNAINAMLGLGGDGNMMGSDTMQTNALAQFEDYARANPDVMQEFNRVSGEFGGSLGEFGRFHYNTYGQGEGRQLPTAQGAQTGMTPQQAQEDAFGRFRDSTGYRFRVAEGMDALNSGFAGSGLVQSGARDRAAIELGQNLATQEVGNYMALLGQQQGIGLGGASAVAGVGQNFANNAGSLIMNNAGNQANASIARAQNNPFGSFMGVLGGGLLGYGNR